MGLEVLDPGMIQNFVPRVNPQEANDVISSFGLGALGLGISVGGLGVCIAGYLEIGTISSGNIAGWLGPHLIADGQIMIGIGGTIMWKAGKDLIDKYNKYKDPCP
ncbi:MAG: hypothetical protein SWH54_06200 [Thermodesulfobacteriota bacterium]|nr:hypothetical protein [Thermodesulfobacteriota bacterium]